MNLDKHALGRMNLRGRDWKDLISAFEALGSDQDLRDFATMGATGFRSQDGSNYTVTSADTVVVFSLFYVARHKGRVVCTTPHPFDSRRRLAIFDFALDTSGATDIVGEDGSHCDLGNVSHMIAAMALDQAMKVRLTAVIAPTSTPSSSRP